jgi:hypothetical protein
VKIVAAGVNPKDDRKRIIEGKLAVDGVRQTDVDLHGALDESGGVAGVDDLGVAAVYGGVDGRTGWFTGTGGWEPSSGGGVMAPAPVTKTEMTDPGSAGLVELFTD